LLKVGPESAGSNPGPAAYGLGGEFPTVTDAALIMGYLDPQGSLSGSVRLRLDLAEKAMLTHIANPLGISVIEAANGIHRIVCEHMATAAKIHAVEKGQDVRRYTLLAFGGAGPIHAREVARRIRCQEIFIPANAGVFSAFGLLVAPMKVDTVRTRFTRLDTIDWSQTEELLKEMEQTLSDQLSSADVPRDSIRFRRTADIRYVGQGFEVETELPTIMRESERYALEQRFSLAYAALFGRHLERQKLEVINWRVEGFADISSPPTVDGQYSASIENKQEKKRQAYFPDINAFVATPVIAESALMVGQTLEGPALIEQAGSTVVVGPGDQFSLDTFGNIRVVIGTRTKK
jgi:N-methylhydantoinase A